MTQNKAAPTPPLPNRRMRAATCAAMLMPVLLLAGLSACSQAHTSASPEKPARASDSLTSAHPFGDMTPAERRAAWLKRKPAPQPAEALAQNGGTEPTVTQD